MAAFDTETVTRESFRIQGRTTDLRAFLDSRGFECSPQTGAAGHHVIEKAFAEK